ncbi:MAG: peptidoglycan-binding protein, partial [Clostridia bacterium]
MPMPINQIENGKNNRKACGKRLFSRRARTWILAVVSVCVFSFVLLPLLFDRASGANAVFIMAHQDEIRSLETPVPFTLEERARSVEAFADMTPEPTSEIQVSQYSILQEDDDYPTVQNLQTRLMELGYLDSDEPSTVYGHATTVAVSLFQRTLSYNMDGIADSELQEHLFSSNAISYEMKLGDSGSDVESMQSRLHELGYYDGKVNGYFGVATEDALEAFQTKNKLDANHVFGVDDRDLLYSPAAKPKIDPTPTPKPTPKPTKKPARTSTPNSGGSSSSSSNDGSASPTEAPGISEPTVPANPPPEAEPSTPDFSASYSPDGLVSVATAMLGKPYNWSQESPSKGFDCSGLVYYSLRTCGVSTSRYSASGFSSVGGWGNIESIDGLSKGDLVFFKN